MSNQPPGGWPPPPMSSPPPPGGYPYGAGGQGAPPPSGSSFDQPTVIAPGGGSPGYPPPPGAGFPPPPPPPGAGFQAPPPPRKSRKGLWITLAVVALVVVAGAVGAVALLVKTVSSTTVAEGECLYFSALSETAAETVFEERECSNLAATYEVGVRLDAGAACPDENYFPFSLVDGDDNAQRLLCLLPNLVEGGCYLFEADNRISPTSCESEGRILIERRVDGTADASLCDDFPPDSAVTYPTPARTYCATILAN